ncbi:transcription elongation factor Spt5 [Candidatus Micrarchaeota archaeon]|nr:transcription elongation factor Spt5 [Candidatus Micrarchaeota archaeon]
MIYIIRVTTGQEKIIAEMLAKKSKAEKLDIYSVVNVDNIKGYLFVEALDENTMAKLTQKMKNVKGFLKQPIGMDEIKNMISAATKQTTSIKMGDIVEMTSGPFKGERARVILIDEAKDQLTVELMEVAVPIPVTINSKTARLAQKAEDNE